MSISIGLVGLGDFGTQFAELFTHHPLVSRIGLCDRVPERIKEFADRESTIIRTVLFQIKDAERLRQVVAA